MIFSLDRSKAVVYVFTALEVIEDVDEKTDGTLLFESDGVIRRIHVTNFKFTSLSTG